MDDVRADLTDASAEASLEELVFGKRINKTNATFARRVMENPEPILASMEDFCLNIEAVVAKFTHYDYSRKLTVEEMKNRAGMVKRCIQNNRVKAPAGPEPLFTVNIIDDEN